MTADTFPDNKVHGDNMGPIWARQDPGGPHVGPMNFAIGAGFFRNGDAWVYEVLYINEDEIKILRRFDIEELH